MKPFCKIHVVSGLSQILVLRHRGDDGNPELALTFRIPGGSHLATVKFSYPDSDEGWDFLDEAFDLASAEACEKLVREQMSGPMGRLGRIDAKPERRLTEEAQADRDSFESAYGSDGTCSCHLHPPCSSCTHPGNPLNQAEDDTCWEDDVCECGDPECLSGAQLHSPEQQP